jgi:hypothetical protein
MIQEPLRPASPSACGGGPVVRSCAVHSLGVAHCPRRAGPGVAVLQWCRHPECVNLTCVFQGLAGVVVAVDRV